MSKSPFRSALGPSPTIQQTAWLTLYGVACFGVGVVALTVGVVALTVALAPLAAVLFGQ